MSRQGACDGVGEMMSGSATGPNPDDATRTIRVGGGETFEVAMEDYQLLRKLCERGINSRQVIARFEIERQVLAMMDHSRQKTILKWPARIRRLCRQWVE